MIESIPFKQSSLIHEKITEFQDGVIELYDDRVRVYMRFYSDQPIDESDLQLGYESVFNDYDIRVKRTNFTGLNLYYSQKNKTWIIYFGFMGFSADLNLSFKKKSEAQEIFDKLSKYLFDEK